MLDLILFSQYVRLILKLFSVLGAVSLFGLWVSGLGTKLLKGIYGFEDNQEVTKFSLLAVCFALVIGVYWMLRTTKYSVFAELVGMKYAPRAKLGTLVSTVLIVFFYNLIVDKVQKHRLFAIVCSAYAFVFAAIAILWKLDFSVATGPLFDWIPGRALGWIYFWAVESLGGIIVGAVFWSFVASSTKTESAKRGYALIVLGGQVGNFFGPAFNAGYVSLIGTQNQILVIVALLLMIPLVMEFYMKVVPARLQESDDAAFAKNKKKTGVFEGLRLLATRPYLMGVAIVSTIYEVVGTISDYQFRVLANAQFSGEAFTIFDSFYAMVIAVVALMFSFGGMSFLLRNLGVGVSLLCYPISLVFVVLALWLKPTLWTFFIGMVVVKAFSYALNSPIKEMIYLPTSKDAKMKAKSIIESFGSKGAKGLGSVVTDALKSDVLLLINAGSMISLGVLGAWILVAFFVGRKYEDLRAKNEIVQ